MLSLPLTIANDKSANEDLTEAPNKYNMKAKTVDSIRTPLFAKILRNTDSIHAQTKEEEDATPWSGNEKHDDGFVNDPRDGKSIIHIHKIVQKQDHRYICTYLVIFSSKISISSRYSFATLALSLSRICSPPHGSVALPLSSRTTRIPQISFAPRLMHLIPHTCLIILPLRHLPCHRRDRLRKRMEKATTESSAKEKATNDKVATIYLLKQMQSEA